MTLKVSEFVPGERAEFKEWLSRYQETPISYRKTYSEDEEAAALSFHSRQGERWSHLIGRTAHHLEREEQTQQYGQFLREYGKEVATHTIATIRNGAILAGAEWTVESELPLLDEPPQMLETFVRLDVYFCVGAILFLLSRRVVATGRPGLHANKPTILLDPRIQRGLIEFGVPDANDLQEKGDARSVVALFKLAEQTGQFDDDRSEGPQEIVVRWLTPEESGDTRSQPLPANRQLSRE